MSHRVSLVKPSPLRFRALQSSAFLTPVLLEVYKGVHLVVDVYTQITVSSLGKRTGQQV